jgi:hypothetical protein
MMCRKSFLLICLALALAMPLCAAEHQYSTAKIVDVQRKMREKVNMYIVNTPVSTETPYFEIKLRLAQVDYTAEFTPRHEDEELPSEWTSGADVSARLEKHYLFLKRPDGSELRWLITKHREVKEAKETGK